MKTSEILQNGHDYLLAHKWLRGHFAKTNDGCVIDSGSRVQLIARGDGTGCTIDRCCGEGAIYAGNPLMSIGSFLNAAEAVNKYLDDHSIHGFNDHVAHDKRDVLRKFRVAIRQLKKEGN